MGADFLDLSEGRVYQGFKDYTVSQKVYYATHTIAKALAL